MNEKCVVGNRMIFIYVNSMDCGDDFVQLIFVMFSCLRF